MDDYTKQINEMNDYLQSFNRNNQLLSDNWKDDQSDRFSQSVLNGMMKTSQAFVQLVSDGRKAIGSCVSQIEDIEKELQTLDNECRAW